MAPLLVVVGVILVWQFVGSVGLVQDFVLPSPLQIAEAGWNARELLLRHVGPTILVALLGFLVGNMAAIALAVLFTHSEIAERGVFPLTLALRSVPFVALAPIIFLSLGYGVHSRTLIVAFSEFFPATVIMVRGLRSTTEESGELMRSYSAGWWTVLWKLRWPSSMPFLFAALRTSAGMAFLSAVIAEWMGSNEGLGFLIVNYTTQFRIPELWATVMVATALSLLAFGLVAQIERHVLRWQGTSGNLPAVG